MKISLIEVENLFGSLNHAIPIDGNNISIIHGPNGCGKTTILNMLSSLANNDVGSLRNISFESFKLTFDDKTTLSINKKDINPAPLNTTNQSKLDLTNSEYLNSDESDLLSEMKNTYLTVTLRKQDGKLIHDQRLSSGTRQELINKLQLRPEIITSAMPHLQQVGTRTWRDRRNGQRHLFSEIVAMLGDQFLNLPEWLTSITSQLKLGFINAQRLLEITGKDGMASEERSAQVRDFVHVYSDEIKSRINETLRLSAVISQKRERTFPQRILQKEYDKVSDTDIRSGYEKLQSRFSKLAETGLQEEFAEIILPPGRMNPTERRVLSLYLDDLNEKLDVFSGLQSQIDIFRKIIGKKFRRKTFNIDRENGFAIRNDIDGKPISPSVLSSGEQHQIVMFYDLIFSSSENLLFIIDEPEISLHIEWQRQFLDDLESVGQLRGHQFLVATHSPQVIGGRRDLAIALDGGVEE